jgi:alkaline phosphatase
MKRLVLLCALASAAWAELPTGSVIFLHPDGASLNHWNAARVRWAGPDSQLEWDQLPAIGLYRTHMADNLSATSHGGGTTHAYGVKVPADSYGMNGREPLVALSGKPRSIMQEAKDRGIAIGIVNTGDLNEPGTGCFLASVPARNASEEIIAQILASGADVILGGGERWFLPTGVNGRHGPGARTDGRDLIAAAKAAGYTVVYNAEELAGAAPDAGKLLGLFAEKATFNDAPEEQKQPHYQPGTPTVAQMTQAALQVLARGGRQFLLVVEEEGTDNFGNHNNAAGTLEALRRADEAIGVARRFVEQHPNTLLLTAADSDASGMQVIGVASRDRLPANLPGGAPLDGRDGTATVPFESAPDAKGRRLPFGIAWIGPNDTYGAVVRGVGLNRDLIRGSFDNTDTYRLMYRTLFGVALP